MMNTNAFLLLFFCAVAAGIASVNATASLAFLFITTTLAALLTVRRHFYTGFAFGAALSLYALVGGVNFSIYRGTIEPDFFRFFTLSILCLTSGYALGTLRYRPAPLEPQSVPLWFIALTAIPALLGTVFMLLQTGVPLFQPALRYSIAPQALLLIETVFVPITLLAASILETPDKTGIKRLSLLVLFIVLLLPAYRGWLGGVFTIFGMMIVAQGFTRRRVVLSLLSVLCALVFFVGLAIVRRSTQGELYTAADSLRVFQAEHLPAWFAQVHFAVRESIALGQWLWQERQMGQTGQGLVLADLSTLLPGQQQAAGALLGDLSQKKSLAGGLTAVLPATLYYDAGGKALPILAVMGAMLGALGARLCASPLLLSHGLYGLVLFYAFHFFHRGLCKPAYLIVPVLLWVVIRVKQRVL